MFVRFLACCVLAYIVTDSYVHGSQKKGISGWSSFYMCDDFKHLNNISWMYDWHMDLSELYTRRMGWIHCPKSTYEHLLPQYVPMVYSLSNTTGHPNLLVHNINIPTEAQYVLGFNEPDHADQAHMTPKEAADRWPEIERHAQGKLLVSPAPAAHNFHWLDEFFQHCNGCRVDFVAAHSYSCNADFTMNYLKAMYERYGRKVWLTEFACPHTTSANRQLHLMRTLLPKLEAADFVFRYSWFQARIQNAMGGGFMQTQASLFQHNSSNLTPLGRFYNNFQAGPHGSQIIG